MRVACRNLYNWEVFFSVYVRQVDVQASKVIVVRSQNEMDVPQPLLALPSATAILTAMETFAVEDYKRFFFSINLH